MKACAQFEKALMLAKDDPEILPSLGLCQVKLGKKVNALATFRRALNSGGQPQVKANVYFQLGQTRRGDSTVLPI